MNKGGRPKATLTLNDVERQKLEAWSRGPRPASVSPSVRGSSWLALKVSIIRKSPHSSG